MSKMTGQVGVAFVVVKNITPILRAHQKKFHREMTQRCCFQPGERLANSNVVWMCDSYCGSEHLCGCQTQHICIPLSKTNAVMAVGILVLCVTSENMNNPSTAFMRRDKTTRSFMIVNDIQIEIIMNILMSIKSTH